MRQFTQLRRSLVVGLVAAAIASTLSPSTVLAGPRIVGQSMLLSRDGQSYVLAAAPGVSKASYDWTVATKELGIQSHQPETSPTQEKAAPMSTTSEATFPINMAEPSQKDTCPPGGSCGPLTAWFSTTVYEVTDMWGQSADFTGNSHVRWLGSNPFYADTIWLTDTLKANGCGVSFGGGGPGFSGSGDTATWNSPPVYQNWAIDNGFTNVHFQTPCGFWQFVQTTRVTVQFGSNWFDSFDRNGFS